MRPGEERVIWEIDERARTVEGLDERGRARPEYAESLGLIRAPFGRRVVATLIEGAILLVLQLPMLIVVLPVVVGLALDGDPVGAITSRGDFVLVLVCALASGVLSTAFVLVQLILLGRRGVTVGKGITGLRAVNVRTLERPGFWRGAVVRYLVMAASFALPLVGPVLVVVLSPLFDPARRGRGWPDLAAATWLVDARNGLHPYDEKRMRIARKTVATDLQDVKADLPSLATPVATAGSAAYIPLARHKGGVLGAVRSGPVPGNAEGQDAAAADPRSEIPTVVAPQGATPSIIGPAPGMPGTASVPPPVAPAPSPVAAAVTAPAAPAWTPPPLLEDAPPAPAPAPAPVPAPAPAPARAITVTLDTGDTVAVTGGGVVLGRAPALAPGEAHAVPVPVPDPSRSISKTHWALLVDGPRVVAVEKGSTNGSTLIRGGAEQDLIPGHPLEVRDGDTVRFGDRYATIAIR